jgi:hypothetical protein
MSNDNIVRVKKDARYFVASNIPFNDKRLSWEARGVMGYLLSKPDEWQVRMADLVNQGPAGLKVIRRVLAELRQYGYMSREKVKGEHGHFSWITTLYESPDLRPYTPDGNIVTVTPSQSRIVSTESSTYTKERVEKIVKKANGTVDQILEIERRVSGKSWTNLPEVYHSYGKVFCEATGLNYHKKYLMDWIATFDEWQQDGYQPVDVYRAVDLCRGKTDISRPGSITFKLRAMKVASPHLEQEMIY